MRLWFKKKVHPCNLSRVATSFKSVQETIFFEYSVTLNAHASKVSERRTQKRIDYARLVRKGTQQNALQHSAFVMGGLRSSVLEGYPLGGQSRSWLQYRLSIAHRRARLRFSRKRQQRGFHSIRGHHIRAWYGATLQKFFDVYGLSLGVGDLSTELNWYNQEFETTGLAPSRNSWAASFGPLMSAEADISGPLVLKLEAAPMIYVHKQAIVSAGAPEGATAHPSHELGCTWAQVEILMKALRNSIMLNCMHGLLSCGDPLATGEYLGEPLFSFEGNHRIHSRRPPEENSVRVALGWARWNGACRC